MFRFVEKIILLTLSISCIAGEAALALIPNETNPPNRKPSFSNPIESRIMKYSNRNNLLRELKQVRHNYERYAAQRDSIGMGTQQRFAQIIHMRAKQLGFSLVSATTQQTADTLLSTWGWEKINCTPGVVFISGLAIEPICVDPKPGLRAGSYKYNAVSDQLSRISSAPVQQSAEAVLSAWGWKKVSCTPGVVFISDLAAETVCVSPRPGLRAGQYKYNPESDQLLRIN